MHRRTTFKRLLRHSIPVLVVIFIIGVVFVQRLIRENVGRQANITWGVTFSTKYAKELGLDWRRVYVEILDSLNVRALRLPVYWNEVEPVHNKYDFTDVDWMLAEAAKRNAKVILVVGRRVPRWPECHLPNWAHELSLEDQNRRVLELVAAEVEHFKKSKAIVAWQVENEPLLDVFGICPPGDAKLLELEVREVRGIDDRPVVITDSGELSLWLPTGLYADILGISMYRVTWNRWFGYFYYPITPAFYQQRATGLYPLIKKVIITELQTEPWPSGGRSIMQTPLPEQYQSMNQKRFQNNVEFARRVGFSEVYLWGVEWWYWVREKGDPWFWNTARQLFTVL